MNDLSEYSRSLLNDAQADLEKIFGNGNKKDLHAFRIDVKKIFAFQDMISFCYGEKIINDTQLNRLFKQCGKVWDLNIHLLTVNKYLPGKNKEVMILKNKLNYLIKDHYDKLLTRYEKKHDKVLLQTQKWINKTLKTKLRFNVKDYFLMKQKKILSLLLQMPGNKEHIHNFRKEIKSFIHNSEGLNNLNPLHLINIKILQKWDAILGEWHDVIQTIEEIEKLMRKFKKGKKQYSVLLKVKTHLYTKRNALLKKFLTQADAHVIILLNRGS